MFLDPLFNIFNELGNRLKERIKFTCMTLKIAKFKFYFFVEV